MRPDIKWPDGVFTPRSFLRLDESGYLNLDKKGAKPLFRNFH
ncbi:hypothetical protein ACFY1P_04410 [Streptomyces sp. NPDC001407]